MLRIKRSKKVGTYLSFLFSYLLFFSFPFNSALAGGILTDTGQTKCYNNSGQIPCPGIGEVFNGQDGNYQGPQPAYQVSADGLVVIDRNTGLMWQQADDGLTKNWHSAVAYCDGLVLGGYADWRLPSRLELVTIVDYGRYSPAINPAFSCRNMYYWSESAGAHYQDTIWVVHFNYGNTNYGYKNDPWYVRCVRDDP